MAVELPAQELGPTWGASSAVSSFTSYVRVGSDFAYIYVFGLRVPSQIRELLLFIGLSAFEGVLCVQQALILMKSHLHIIRMPLLFLLLFNP